MKFFAVASLLFVGTLAVPTSQCGECQKHHGHHPGGNQPGGNQPGGNQPGGNQPGGNQPGGNQPGGNQPGGNQPGGIQPGGNQPGGNQPGGNQPGGIQPGGNQPGNQPGGNNPGGNNPGNPGGNAPYKPCPSGLYSNPQCCATNVLGVAALDCKNPSSAPTSSDNFKSVCGGQQPLCCVVPAAGQGVLCTAPVGGGQPGGGNPGSNPGNNPGGNNPGGNPGGNNPGNDYKACPSGLYGNPQCCATNVLGVAALDCANPSSKPTSGDNFKSTCGAAGKQALCCAVPVAGLDVLCTPASGGGNPGSNPGSNPGGNPGGNQPGGNNPGSNPGGNQPGSNNPGNNPGGNQPGSNNPGNNPGSSNPGGNNPGNNQGGNQPGGGNNYKACPSGLYSNPQCCATNILGVAALDCGNPSRKPTSSGDFKSTCASDGKRPVCCVVPAAGQGVLCTSASG
ncbi:beta ketoadipyl CoA thiolase, th1 [Epichloe festucae Fl1]|uniref:Beta ketoadipyl CoA thiolase, th1 n=1 Tax=Epichloe festucae (strain Fl1) TaxID=877507 RepID=A0A7S9KR39_EPIFF|nr:beta ketoadipyl CoA thiolase, th1 [Epichloe festucae Fl1]